MLGMTNKYVFFRFIFSDVSRNTYRQQIFSEFLDSYFSTRHFFNLLKRQNLSLMSSLRGARAQSAWRDAAIHVFCAFINIKFFKNQMHGLPRRFAPRND
jgi:hypothetical protein